MTLPNILTILRIFFAFLLLALAAFGDYIYPEYLHYSWKDYFLAVLFTIASMTDFFDGMIARRFHKITVFGEIFDPLADKMLLLAAFLSLIILERADVVSIFLILSREFFITGLRVVAASRGLSVAASKMGKLKTTLQVMAVILLFLDWPIGTPILWLSVFVTIYSGYEYTKAYYKVD